MNKKVIIFDFDGTIADSLEEVIEIANSLSKKYSFSPIDEKNLKELKNLSLFEISKRWKISKWKLFLMFWSGKEEFKKIVDRVEPFKECAALIRELKEQRFTLGIITFNSVFSVKSFLKRNDLNIFDFVISASTIFGKARSINKIIQKYGLKTEDVVYIGDEIRDIEAAKKAGVDSIAVSWGYNSRVSLLANNPTRLVDKPEEIIKMMNE